MKHVVHRYETMGFKWYLPQGTAWVVNGHEAYLNSEIMNRGKHFIDVGAHIGRWSIPASSYYDRVTAFEPTPFTNRILRVNVRLNRLKNVHVYQKAASNVNGTIPFWLYPERHGGANSILKHHLGHTGIETIQVETTRLDDHSQADVVKIDVEGWELQVLQGAERQLDGKPKLLIEIHDLLYRSPIIGLLERHGYSNIKAYPIPGYPDIETLVAR